MAEEFKQMTEEEAIEFAESGAWKDMSFEERAVFGMTQRLLCMPFSILHEAVSETLGRPVFNHELGLARKDILAELVGTKEAPTFEDIIKMLPEEKLIILGGPEK